MKLGSHHRYVTARLYVSSFEGCTRIPEFLVHRLVFLTGMRAQRRWMDYWRIVKWKVEKCRIQRPQNFKASVARLGTEIVRSPCCRRVFSFATTIIDNIPIFKCLPTYSNLTVHSCT